MAPVVNSAAVLCRTSLDDLATELILPIFRSCLSARDALALAQTSHRYHAIFQSKKLAILTCALEASCGPLADAIQLVTQTSASPVHILRDVPISFALLKQVHDVGLVARKWQTLYPAKKWKIHYAERRLLSASECYRLRQAVYRIWLYSTAFHIPSFPRETRLQLRCVVPRARLVREWTTSSLHDVRDLLWIMRGVVENSLCPSNSTIIRKFRKRHPDVADLSGLMFNIHLNYPPPRLSSILNKVVTGRDSWGDSVQCYYIVQDMMKLDPEQIMTLREERKGKEEVEQFVKELGAWFENNGETMGETVALLLSEREDNLEEEADGVGGIIADADDEL